MDILGMPQGALSLRDSNPGHIVLRPGGVGRNIAQRIAALGTGCTLLTVFGTDTLADTLCAACAKEGIDIAHALTAEGSTCVYLCVHDAEGDMLTAINDMALTRALTPAYAEASLPVINASALCVLDANPPTQTLLTIARQAEVPLLMDPVSMAKLHRARPLLAYLAAFKPNIHEARSLTGRTTAQDCAKALVAMGVGRAFVSLGEEGLCCADAGMCAVLPVQRQSAAPKTGAGDALCAGLAVAMAAGESTLECAKFGMRCAAEFLQQVEEQQ